MRLLGLLLLAIALAYVTATATGPSRRAGRLSDVQMWDEIGRVEGLLQMYQRERTLPQGGEEELSGLKKELRLLRWEEKRRQWNLDRYLVWLSGVGGVLFLLSFVGRLRLRPRGAPEVDARKLERIPEVQPSEEYVDEWEFERRIEGGFKTRDQALAWLLQDPMLKCDYCGAELQSPYTSDREALQLITFYKKVPPGAKDLRLVLGSYWFGRPATELRCPKCNRTIRR